MTPRRRAAVDALLDLAVDAGLLASAIKSGSTPERFAELCKQVGLRVDAATKATIAFGLEWQQESLAAILGGDQTKGQ